MVAAAHALILLAASSAAPDTTQLILGTSGVAGLAGLFVYLVVRSLRQADRQTAVQLKPAWEEIQRLRAENRNCERRNDMLVKAMRDAGIDVPEANWDE